MQKRGEKLFVFSASLSQIILLLSLSFTFSFLLSENSVSAETSGAPIPTGGNGLAASEFGFESPSLGGRFVYDSATGQYLGPSGATFPSGGQTPLPADAKVFFGGAGAPAAATAYPGYSGVKLPLMQGKVLVNSPVWGHLVQGLMWSLVVVGAIQLIGSVAGLDKETTNALSISAVSGIMAGQLVKGWIVKSAAGKSTATIFNGQMSAGTAGFAVGLIIAAVVFVALYKKEKKQLVTFQCLPWEPPLGGSQCERCNDDPFRPCSEYRCKSLGQACQLLNPGTGNEQCTWVSKFDVESPKITPWTEKLVPAEARYVPDTSIRPPAIGVKIQMPGEECLEAFTPLQFGILTNEPAQCKIDYNHTANFDAMQFYFGGDNYYSYNHTQLMRLPSVGTDSDSPVIQNDGTFAMYARCRDANGNYNVDEYAISFCVKKGPDTTPPRIERTSIVTGSPVQYRVDQVPIEVYTNEPAECKWSTQSKPFGDMENTMRCAADVSQMNSDLLYTCSGNLTGIKDREDNNFYFRCKDQPGSAENERNVMVQSYPLTLKGSQSLSIDDVSPNGTIFGSTTTVQVDLEVKTSNGAEEGKALCSFSETGVATDYVPMFETNDFTHKQTLYLTNGTYDYHVRCVDAGGNSATGNTTFSVKIDRQAPRVTRVYRDQALKIVTDEEAECSYSLTSCNFAITDGVRLEYASVDAKTRHYADWNPGTTYYIRCVDGYGNTPDESSCSVVVRPTQLAREA